MVITVGGIGLRPVRPAIDLNVQVTVDAAVGGFYRAPARSELCAHIGQLEQARQDALETVSWMATFPFPDFDRDYTFVTLHHLDEYPIARGRIVSSQGLDITATIELPLQRVGGQELAGWKTSCSGSRTTRNGASVNRVR